MNRYAVVDSIRVWVVSELFYPEETSTGYFLTLIAEALAEKRSAGALCAQPTYSVRGIQAPSSEWRNGVFIRRCPSTTLDKNHMVGKLVNVVTVSLSIFLHALYYIKRSHTAVVVTNPPLLPFLISLTCWLKGARCVLVVHDVYPNVLVASGMTKPGSLLARMTEWLNRRLYNSMDRVITLGRDMQVLALAKLGSRGSNAVVIPNWGQVDEIRVLPKSASVVAAELRLEGKFVVQYAGNIGRTHGIEDMVEAARLLVPRSDVHFLIYGTGAKRRWLEETVAAENLANIMVRDPVPRKSQDTVLSACDLSIICFMPGMAGVSVPSRMYNVMAAGRAILAVCDEDSEIALVVREERIGWVAPPLNPHAIADVIGEAAANPELVAEMGRRARAAVESKYTFAIARAAYQRIVEQVEQEQGSRT